MRFFCRVCGLCLGLLEKGLIREACIVFIRMIKAL